MPQPPRKRRRSAATVKHANAAAIGEARTIVYVHGIGNKPVPSVLKCQWDQALFGFDLGERSRLAYWVNRDYYPQPEAGTCSSGDRVDIESSPTGTGVSVRQHLGELSLEDEAAAVTDDPRAQAALVAIAATVERDAEARALRHEAWRAAGRPVVGRDVESRAVEAKILPLPEILRRWITRRLTRALLRDVNDFLFVEARRERMRESLRERLRVGGGPFVVVAHSLGSVIAYDVLSSSEFRDLDVRLLVTAGSPLGIQEVQDRLAPLTGQRAGLRVPPCVARWLNVADPIDPVAIDKRLRNDFAPSASGVEVEDDLEWNADSPRSPHSGTGYLRTSPVRRAVRDSVDTGLFQPVAAFVVARDVVRSLENAGHLARQPVLIELAEPAAEADTTLDDVRARVVDRIVEGARRTAERASVPFDEGAVRLQPLRRYVAADLTREEAESLAATVPGTATSVYRVWRNARKTALLDVSAATVQALPAQASYRAVGRGIVWAVLDSGVNPEHPHFAGHANIECRYDCTTLRPLETMAEARARSGDDRTGWDDNGHGTHVAGIIAGSWQAPAAEESKSERRKETPHPTPQTPDPAFVAMAPEAKLHAYKVLDREGNGEDAWIIKALDHIAETNERAGRTVIHGVNLSLGGPFDQSTFGAGHTPLCVELRRLWRQGVVVVIAAGNEGFAVLQTLDGTVDANMDLSIGDPANLEEAIAVGSVHKENPHTYGVSYFSSRGPTADGRQKPDLVAPGERVRSCRHRFPAGAITASDLYVEMSGTSVAAPHVSGVIASFLSVRREFIGNPDRVKELLLRGCTDLERDRYQQGAGMPNLVKMLVET